MRQSGIKMMRERRNQVEDRGLCVLKCTIIILALEHVGFAIPDNGVERNLVLSIHGYAPGTFNRISVLAVCCLICKV